MLVLVDISLSAWKNPRKRKAVMDLLDRFAGDSPTARWHMPRDLTVMAFNRQVQRVTLDKLSRLPAAGATDISGALEIALELLSPETVLVTDGIVVHPDTEDAVLLMAEACHGKGLAIHCLSILDDDQVNDALLSAIADRTGGQFIKVKKELDPATGRMLDIMMFTRRLKNGDDPNIHRKR